MRIIKIEDLEPGMILASPIYGSDGKLLLSRNVIIKESFMKRLSTLKIGQTYIYDELTEDINVEQVFRAKTLTKAFHMLNKKKYDSCMLVATMLVDNIMNHIEDLPNMAALSAYDNYTFLHSMNVGVLAAMVGIELEFSEEKIRNLTAAGLLHDIGKEKIPTEILTKPGPLTEEESKIIQKHPVYGYEMIKNSFNIPATVKQAVLCHHENCDGSGYPGGRTAGELHIFTKIIHICDVYDAMVSKRSYKEAINPADVIEYIMACSETMFDRNCLIAFKRSVFPYATGAKVMLSNGETAIIKKNYKGMPERPDVKIISTGETICLRDTNNIVIENFCD